MNPGETGQAIPQQTALLRAERNRRSVNSTWAAIAARLAALVTSFVAIPLTIGYLGVGQYGALVTLTSLTSMFAFADLGLGNGLLNLIADAHGRDDRAAAARAVSSAFFMLGAVAVVLAAILGLVFLMGSMNHVSPLTGWGFGDQIVPSGVILAAAMLVSLPFGIVDRVRLAYQEGYLTSIVAISTGFVGLAVLLMAINLRLSLPGLVAAISLPPVIALFINGYELFRRRRPWLSPSVGRASRSIAIRLARLGFLFFVLQLAVAVAFQSDVIVAGLVVGPTGAATYSVALKFFFVVPSLIALFLATLWPAYAEALARSDHVWIRNTLRQSMTIAGLVSLGASLFLLVAGRWLIRLWTGGAIDPPFELLLGAALWSVTYSVLNAVAMLLNAASVVMFQVAVAAVMAVASITLSVVLAKVVGLSGVVWGTLIAYVVFSALPVLVFLPRLLRSIESRSVPDDVSHG